ncbi:MAG TPA: bacteriohemerythrin [Vicinamibacterales bacterium]|jgi:hemerythrin
MAAIEWSARMNVGIPEIDRQHQKLLELFNDLEEGLSRSLPVKKPRVLFAELVSYSKYHFLGEENLMQVAGWAGRDDHARVHAEFVAKVTELERTLECEGNLEAALASSRFLRHWILRHIVVADRLAFATMEREGRLVG